MLKVKNVVLAEGMPKICISITGATVEEIIQNVEQVKQSEADIVEWRVDYFTGDVDKGLCVFKKIIPDYPLIFTFRTKDEGGQAAISASSYLKLNQLAIHSGAVDFIDVELMFDKEIRNQLILQAKNCNVHVIVSNHDFEKTPANQEMINRIKEAQVIGASIAKLAVMPNNVDDVLRLLSVTNEMRNKKSIPIVTMSMGGMGLVSRLVVELVGSCMTFGALGEPSAPGQIDCTKLKDTLILVNQNIGQ
ncbi:3-dehydroquinate dehydratase [Amphibacillus marinus]|uniref:3-dehydroquinate dehydratase n=1 Tax=Amphibacillus marinus TaxID=872970 RepID=A0A1H8Q6F3_9BACI|nr:type I 3-dehydroquinate dehydratase [Amphibacillus marinus]SEO49805.1 3-dehydroquinate dehydratase [Amphibacillus marinus]